MNLSRKDTVRLIPRGNVKLRMRFRDWLGRYTMLDMSDLKIVVLDVGDIIGITEAFVLASGSNTRQVRTICDEVELAVVIGSRTKNVSADDALDHVFGYTIGLDITDRDLQKQEKQFGRCKSFDSYTPIGPFVYADADVRDASIKLWQNGELRQSTRTSRMIHSVAQIISFVSQSLTLFPGDVILTGTPAGVGPIQAGDELEAEIDDWPRLRNTVAIAQDSPTGQR